MQCTNKVVARSEIFGTTAYYSKSTSLIGRLGSLIKCRWLDPIIVNIIKTHIRITAEQSSSPWITEKIQPHYETLSSIYMYIYA